MASKTSTEMYCLQLQFQSWPVPGPVLFLAVGSVPYMGILVSTSTAMYHCTRNYSLLLFGFAKQGNTSKVCPFSEHFQTFNYRRRIQSINFELAVGHNLSTFLVLARRDLNPVTTYYVTIYHETECKKNVAFICNKAFWTEAIYSYSPLKYTCKR